jgi:hypothetical protein
LCVVTNAQAQKGAFGEDIKTDEQKIEEKIDKVTGEKVQKTDGNNTAKSTKRTAPNKGKKSVSKFTKTYSVLLFSSEDPIDINHKALQAFGDDLFFRQIPNEKYYYMVGKYKSEKEAKIFINTIKANFPDASLVNDIDYPHIKF